MGLLRISKAKVAESALFSAQSEFYSSFTGIITLRDNVQNLFNVLIKSTELNKT